jgi:HEAT repeat protein
MAGIVLYGCRDSAQGLEAPDAKDRRKALTALAKEDSESAAEKVSKMVAHEDLATAGDAVWALGRMTNPRATEVIRQVALRDARPTIRREAAVAMGQRPSEASVKILRQMVQSDQTPDVRAEAAASLGNVGSVADVDVLVGAVESASAPEDLPVESRAMGAIERLVGVTFYYDPKAPPAERRKAIDRMRMVAKAAATGLPKKGEKRE